MSLTSTMITLDMRCSSCDYVSIGYMEPQPIPKKPVVCPSCGKNTFWVRNHATDKAVKS